MASTSHPDRAIISGINVTPLVDVVLVLLVVLMVTASYVVSHSIPLDLPRGATGESAPTVMALSIDREGKVYLEGDAVTLDELRLRIRASARVSELRASIAADGATSHRSVVRVIDALRKEGVSRIALSIEPEEGPR